MRFLFAFLILSFGLPVAEAYELVLQVDAKASCTRRAELQTSLEQNGHLVLPTSAAKAESISVRVSGDEKQVQIEITGGATALREHIVPAPCETQTEVAVAFITTTLAGLTIDIPTVKEDQAQAQDAEAQTSTTPVTPAQSLDYRTQQRATLLATYLERYQSNSARDLGLMATAAGTFTTIVGGLVLREEPSTLTAMIAFGGATFMGGGIASFLVEDVYRIPVVGISTMASASLMLLASSVAGSDGSGTFGSKNPLYVVMAATTALSAGLVLTDTLLERPVSPATLERHYRRLRNPESRSLLTKAELLQMEKDFKRHSGVLPVWLRMMPIVMQSAGFFYVATKSEDSREKTIAYSLSGGSALAGGIAYLVQHYIGYQGYQRDIRLTKSNVTIQASGLGVQGTF